MPNYGIAPPDASTDRGQLRFLVPDSHYEPTTPPPDHPEWTGDYEWFSDTALDVFLQRAGDDVDAAAIIAWGQIGDYWAAQSASIQTDDLKVNDLWRRAQFWYDKVTAAKAEMGADVFALATIGGGCWCHCHVELAANPVCCGLCRCD